MKTKITATDINRVSVRFDTGYETEYWCPMHGGYVYQIDEFHPGTTGRQVCEHLRSTGNTLWNGDPDKYPLVNLIRREYKALVNYRNRR